MDAKRLESSSSPLTVSSSKTETSAESPTIEMYESASVKKAGATQPLHEYGPFPGEVAYPPATYLSPGQPFPQHLGSEYPYIFYLPMNLVHENFAKVVDDVTKVNIDIDSTDGNLQIPRSFTEVETIVEDTDDSFEYRYPYPFSYPVAPYGVGGGFGYPRPYGFGYGYPRPFIGGYIGPIAPFPPIVW